MTTRAVRVPSGEAARCGRVVAVALMTVVVLAAILFTRGWAFAVAAWFGASTATFAIATARAGRAAHAGEHTERTMLEHRGGRKASRTGAGGPAGT
jgi:hypothetical protein